MSGLQNFLAPFSHLLFANRNLVIFFLCLCLFLAALDALIHRWKTQRLNQDLSAAKSTGNFGSAGRRYSSTPAPVEAAPEPGGALPPIKGGRSYARNLGSALQKAGMSTQPIYSPPTPPGWAANTNPGQPAQPGAPAQYPGPTPPWAAPAAPATPWAFQGGAGRPPAGPAPSPVPFYQPQPSVPPSQPTGVPQSPMPSPQGPGLYSPPTPTPGAFAPPPPPYGQPALQAPSMGSAAPAPSFAPPGLPNPSMAPAFPAPMMPTAEPPATETGRRGKPKRRRFNFNVLENLEKMVQAKTAEPVPTSTWTPSAPAPTAPPASPQAGFQTGLQPPAAVPSTPPAAAPAIPEKSVTPQAASLPLPFHSPAEAAAAPGDPKVEEPLMDFSAPATEEKPAEVPDIAAEAATAASEPEDAAEPEPKADARRSMRSMMFGEEVAAPEAEAEPAPESAQGTKSVKDAETPAPAESNWPSYSWSRREETSATAEEPAPADSTPADEAGGDVSPDAEPVAQSTSSESFDPWKPSYAPLDESTAEPVAPESEAGPDVDAADLPSRQVPEEPVVANGGKSGAGTLVIIEDDPTAASYYATLFRGNGYQVEVANDGVSGVDLCTRVQPQVILLDVMMPRQNGILVLQTLRASDETKNTPVVVMSNFSEPTLIKRALQLGALEYVIKTQVEGPALLNALPRWMNREKAFAAA